MRGAKDAKVGKYPVRVGCITSTQDRLKRIPEFIRKPAGKIISLIHKGFRLPEKGERRITLPQNQPVNLV